MADHEQSALEKLEAAAGFDKLISNLEKSGGELLDDRASGRAKNLL